MKKTAKGIRQVDGKIIPIEEREPYPEEPSRKDIINHLLGNLQSANEHYEKEFLNFDKKSIPREFLDIFWGLRSEVDHFLMYFDGVLTTTKSGKTVGRNKTTEAMKIASDVVDEFRQLNQDKDALPTGKYLADEVNARINEMALRGEPCPMNISTRTGQDWIKKMRDKTFT
ncbi:hypothetical protein ICN19_08345 [Polynucleobacter sp. AP-Capit-er-40B-B4]|uniref:hypothetical protein n=1 Tax=Polynucleobacter sp. AP-Capit-er-40B-B4 TaxID=2576927 RepID=UPI001C0C5F60|nr:hypothetical protein [Polynucleobacter sp. AP-Capit-er-40B-B4]MBU3582025.1 hypothetical protein [Polynucleobacter sp. AP-Capit-er-40B-B4]